MMAGAAADGGRRVQPPRPRDALRPQLGLPPRLPFLHFECCYYRAIDWAIEHGLQRVEAGAQGRHKIQRGYLPQPTYCAHWIAHTGLRRAVAAFLDREREMVEQKIEQLAEYSPFRHADAEPPEEDV